MEKEQLILQINIPFCYHKCAYCCQKNCKYDANVIRAYVQAVLKETEAASEGMEDFIISAVSIEGGSPVLASPGGLQEILRAVRKHFCLAEDVQISLQTMPGDYSRALMQKMRDCGVNHWIIGMQTAELAEHNLLQRPYKYDALTMVDAALKNFNLRDLSFDLLYGIPKQTLRSWQNTLNKALYYAPDHISLYPLRIEKGTALEQSILQGELMPYTEEQQRELYLAARELLINLGYYQYSRFDFAKPGHENRFRLGQMNGIQQLGIGYGAVTLLDGVTYTNGHSLREYLEHSNDLSVIANNLTRLDEAALKTLARARGKMKEFTV